MEVNLPAALDSLSAQEDALRPRFQAHYGQMEPARAVHALEPPVRSLLAEALMSTEADAETLLERLPAEASERQSALIHLATSLTVSDPLAGERLIPLPRLRD